MTCAYPNCARTDIRGRDLCTMHYQRWKANPDTYPYPVRDTLDAPSPPWCDCPQPSLTPITMFGWLTLTDVHECTTCRRTPAPAGV